MFGSSLALNFGNKNQVYWKLIAATIITSGGKYRI